MKTRKIEVSFSIPVPAWLPTTYQLKLYWKTLLFKLWPTRCGTCNRRVDFKGSEFRGMCHTQRVMISQYAQEPICGHCLAEKVSKYYDRAILHQGKCDCCGEFTRVTGGITDRDDYLNLGEVEYNTNQYVAKTLGLDVRYGMAWWNGFKICRSCIVEVLHQNRSTSSTSVTVGKKHYFINHRGALINYEHHS